jgi:hypothetical protein
MAKTTRNSGVWRRLVQFATKNWKSLGGGAAVAITGLWTPFTYFVPAAGRNPASPPTLQVVAQSGTGIASGNNTIITGPVTIGPPIPSPTVPPPRNPNALYQYGEAVAEVQGAVISQANGTVTFQAIHTAGKADPSREVEYQDWVLRCPDLAAPRPGVFGQFSGVVAGATCTIVRKIP